MTNKSASVLISLLIRILYLEILLHDYLKTKAVLKNVRNIYSNI